MRDILIPVTQSDWAEINRRAEYFVAWVNRNRKVYDNPINGQSRNPISHLRDEKVGQFAECVAAKYLGLPWIFKTERFKVVDVGPFWVRGTGTRDRCLIFRLSDKCEAAEHGPWLSVYMPGLDATYGIVQGWLFGHECQRPIYWRTASDPTRKPAWFVPPQDLRALNDPALALYLGKGQGQLFG